MALAEFAVTFTRPSGEDIPLRLRPEQLADVLGDAREEEQPLLLEAYLREYVAGQGLRVPRTRLPTVMDAILAALRGEPSAWPIIDLEENPAEPPPSATRRTRDDLAQFLRQHPCVWVATGDLVRAQAVVEAALAREGFPARVWTAATELQDFVPNARAANVVDGDPFALGLMAALRDEPDGPTSYVFVDPSVEDFLLEDRPAREYFRQLAARVETGRDRLRLVVLKTHARVPDRWGGTVMVYRLAFEGGTPLLDSLGEDVTAKARRGDIAAAEGRDDTIGQLVEILNERSGTPNVPLLIGEPGVGKTAVVEELARLVATGDARLPEWLRRRRVLSLPPSVLSAGDTPSLQAQRVESIAREIEVNRDRVLLFIDEAHELMADPGAPSMAQPAAIQQLKAGLARGQYPMILATTPNESARIERDPAFMRRLVPVYLSEMSPEETVRVLSATWVPRLVETHGLRQITAAAVRAAVDGAAWYLPGANRPAGPIRILSRAASRRELASQRTVDVPHIWQALSALLARPVAPPTLDDADLWERFDRLDARLHREIVGQEHVFDRLRPVLLGYLFRRPEPRRKPIVLLFVGPPGVGKTQTAKILSDELFGDAPIVYDMASYGAEHQVADLLGSPPGYVGSMEGARVVRDIRSRPSGQAVMLFDEFGRAHPDIPQRLMRIFDEGFYKDSTAREGDFRDTIMILTSNDLRQTEERSERELRDHLMQYDEVAQRSLLDPAIVRRIDGVIGFVHLTREAGAAIARDQLDSLAAQLQWTYGLDCRCSEQAVACLADLGTGEEGASPIQERIRRLGPEALDTYRWQRANGVKRLFLTASGGDVTWRSA